MLSRSKEFFDFVRERELIRLRKEADPLAGEDAPQEPPWTDDLILQTYKFTNVHRHHDRTSRILRDKFYTNHFSEDHKTILMNAATFRYFGTHEFASAIGWTDFDAMDDFHWENVKEIAQERLDDKERVFTGAYVITNQGISAPKQEVVVDYFLKSLQRDVEEIVEIATSTQNWEDTATTMRFVCGFGGSGFMTKEVLLDTTYTGFWNNEVDHPEDGYFSLPADWWDWTPIGPGARRGAARVMGDNSATQLKEDKAGVVINLLLMDQGSYLPKEWDLLCPHDIQFQLCEFDKYERVRLGQGRPRSKYHAR